MGLNLIFGILLFLTCCYLLLGQEACSVRENTCDDKQCVNIYTACDGKSDCNDGSDESSSTCPDGTEPYLEGDYLVVSDYKMGYLYQIDIPTGKVRRLPSTGPTEPKGVAIDTSTNDIYYTDEYDNSIKVLVWKNKTTRIIYGGVDANVKLYSLALNMEDGVVYYTESVNPLIGEVNISSGSHRVIQQGAGLDARSLAYDSKNKMLYWSDAGNSSGIYKCSVVGESPARIAIITDNITQPLCFTVDWTEGRIYWMDTSSNWIWSADLDGSNREVIAKQRWSVYNGMTATRNHIFYTQDDRYSVRAWERHTRDFHQYAEQRFNSTFGITPNKPLSDLCMRDYVHCGTKGCVYKYHVCDGVEDCADGSDEVAPLCDGGKKEYLEDNFLITTDGLHSSFYQINPENGDVIHIVGAVLAYPFSLAVNQYTGDIYCGGDRDQAIYKYSMTTRTATFVFREERSETSIGAIALDADRDLLYFANNQPPAYIDEIKVADGKVTRRLYEDPDGLPCCGMFVDPKTRILYWSDEGLHGIYSVSLEESSPARKTVVGNLSGPSAFTIDFTTGEMFFGDYKRIVIEKSNLDGSNRKIIYQEDAKGRYYNTMTHDPKYLYITLDKSSFIRRIDRTSFEVHDFTEQSFAYLTGIAYYKSVPMTTENHETQGSTPGSDGQGSVSTEKQQGSTGPVNSHSTHSPGAQAGNTRSSTTIALATAIPIGVGLLALCCILAALRLGKPAVTSSVGYGQFRDYERGNYGF